MQQPRIGDSQFAENIRLVLAMLVGVFIGFGVTYLTSNKGHDDWLNRTGALLYYCNDQLPCKALSKSENEALLRARVSR